jgi:tRNA uridine 5-carboxymethylaminomethyl modification enzyme
MFIYPKKYDVIVVGAGHAGCEAALACSRMNFSTLLVTLNLDTIAQMSCNTCIGGVAKGQIVREIDALGGEMAKNTDRTGIQFRTLNMSKGPAVQSPRAQCDKKLYQFTMKHTLEKQKNLDLIQAEATDIILSGPGGKVRGILCGQSVQYYGKAVIITTGTFLKGLIHIGETTFKAGRSGEFSAEHLSASLTKHGFEVKRLKTGTPPRINGRTVDFSRIVKQPSDIPPVPFSHFTREIKQPLLPCWLTYTNKKTHEIIAENFHRTPLFSGQITGIGPRYCPSIEDKVKRFRDRHRHQIFLEPEGYNTEEIYCNGISTSLPLDVQVKMLQTIKGLEKARLMRPGYAIEYDFCPPTQLKPNLETKLVENLFFAGQLNGTSGYEEAAGQGIMAGINACLKIKGEEPFILDRSEGYIGVLIDDLVTKGVLDPYRMFTSRAEYRLILRSDNADMRLMKYGYKFGLITEKDYKSFLVYKEKVGKEILRLEKEKDPVTKLPLAQLIRQGKLTVEALLAPPRCIGAKKRIKAGATEKINKTAGKASGGVYDNAYVATPERVFNEALIEIKYEGYIRHQASEINKFLFFEKKRISACLDYNKIPGLLTESKHKLIQIKPVSIGQASRISGVTPADIGILMVYLEKFYKQSKP